MVIANDPAQPIRMQIAQKHSKLVKSHSMDSLLLFANAKGILVQNGNRFQTALSNDSLVVSGLTQYGAVEFIPNHFLRLAHVQPSLGQIPLSAWRASLRS